MRDLRPDVVFVIDGDVWRDFQALRARWVEPLCNGFRDECIWRTRQAIRAGDPAAAAHWQKVMHFSEAYGLSWVSAVEIDGEMIREEPKFSVMRYPEDDELIRVVIAAQR